MTRFAYPIELIPDGDGYMARFPDLPEALTGGGTFTSAGPVVMEPAALAHFDVLLNGYGKRDDMELDTGVGTCGKEGQSVPVGVGQPTLYITGLTVGGM